METILKNRGPKLIQDIHKLYSLTPSLTTFVLRNEETSFFKQEQTIVTTDSGHRQELVSKNKTNKGKTQKFDKLYQNKHFQIINRADRLPENSRDRRLWPSIKWNNYKERLTKK